MKTKGSLKHEVFIATTITILLVLLVCGLAIVAYRVENAMNLEPFVLFTIIDNMDGTFSYSIFRFTGKIDLGWMSGFIEKVNQFQVLIHPSLKAFVQTIAAILDGVYEWIKQFIL